MVGVGLSILKYGSNPEDVFSHFPFFKANHPLLFVVFNDVYFNYEAPVTMVLAVNYGHKMQKNKVILWLSLTIVGGTIFLLSQAWSGDTSYMVTEEV